MAKGNSCKSVLADVNKGNLACLEEIYSARIVAVVEVAVDREVGYQATEKKV